LTLACNNRCVFCAQDGVAPRDEQGVRERLERARAAADEVTFVGGEPTLDPGLVEHVALARSLGFRRVGVQTNARRLADAGCAAALAGAGLTDVHVSLHAADARAHDYHTGVDGSFAETMQGIAAARAASLVVVVTTVLTRSSFRGLASLPRALAPRGVAGWVVLVARAAGRAFAASDRVVPRLALAVPFALHAIEAAAALGLPAWIGGAPLCLLGPLASRAIATDARAYAPVCAACPSRGVCPGVDPDYLERFEGDELSARDAPSLPCDRPHVRDMFVGIGELAPVPPRPRAKVALPMLGKVRPAIAEVPAGAEKKSGEALRAILPALFDDAKRAREPNEGR